LRPIAHLPPQAGQDGDRHGLNVTQGPLRQRRRQPVHSSAAEISKFVMAVTAARAVRAYSHRAFSIEWSRVMTPTPPTTTTTTTPTTTTTTTTTPTTTTTTTTTTTNNNRELTGDELNKVTGGGHFSRRR
jgi:hypothetical protein